MNIHFTDSQVPELSHLTPRQRRVVRRGAFEMLCSERHDARWQAGLPAGIGTFLGCMLASASFRLGVVAPSLLVMFLVGIIGGYIGFFFSGHQLTKKLRPYFRRFIEEHQDEIPQES